MARQRQLQALLLVSLLEPIFEEDAIEARFFSKRECHRGTGACWLACGNLEQAAEGRVIVVVVRSGLSVAVPFLPSVHFPFPAVAQDSGTHAQRCQRRS